MRIIFLVRSLLLAILMLALPIKSPSAIILSITIAPPPLPIYEQPLCPGDGYIWTPGYWAYGDYGFFWVPGTWVLVPEPGFLWTPGYWGWGDGVYIFHEGYWGPHVGFYGGIVYGFGYEGVGYEGGYWNRGAFFYNRSVNNVRNVRNVYNKTVIVNNITVNNVSYNGGVGGVPARPTRAEEAVQSERHFPPSRVQTQHLQAASTNRQLYESANHGKPPIAATAKPAEFKGHGVVAAKAAARAYMPPSARTADRPGASNVASRPAAPVHPNDRPPSATRPSISNTGRPKLDKKYQQDQEKLIARQEQERRKLQQKQEQEHQRMGQGRGGARTTQLEQKHQQQTQQLEQKHVGEQQKLQDRQQGSRNPRK